MFYPEQISTSSIKLHHPVTTIEAHTTSSLPRNRIETCWGWMVGGWLVRFVGSIFGVVVVLVVVVVLSLYLLQFIFYPNDDERRILQDSNPHGIAGGQADRDGRVGG